MKALVTGVAGFIGSNLALQLRQDGHTVVGVDCFTDYYDVDRKRRNAADVEGVGGAVHDVDLAAAPIADLSSLLASVDVVFHFAGQPGVRKSWGDEFGLYDRRNIAATQRLLEAVEPGSLDRFVFASSSSVYGNAETYPTEETAVPQPVSPYGVTKLASEHLCNLYGTQYGLPVVSLRLFTVYGPRQRPDMAFTRMIDAALTGEQFPLFGDGSQVREFTYVGDVVAAALAAATSTVDAVPAGVVCNVAGGSEVVVSEVIDLVGELVGRPVPVKRQDAAIGDVTRTGGDATRARALLGWAPEVDLRAGLTEQIAWQRDLSH